MARTNPHNLTDRQHKFINEYLMSRDLNATKAYKSVYPNCKSDAAARSSASRLLRSNPNINLYIQWVGMGEKYRDGLPWNERRDR